MHLGIDGDDGRADVAVAVTVGVTSIVTSTATPTVSCPTGLSTMRSTAAVLFSNLRLFKWDHSCFFIYFAGFTILHKRANV